MYNEPTRLVWFGFGFFFTTAETGQRKRAFVLEGQKPDVKPPRQQPDATGRGTAWQERRRPSPTAALFHQDCDR